MDLKSRSSLVLFVVVMILTAISVVSLIKQRSRTEEVERMRQDLARMEKDVALLRERAEQVEKRRAEADAGARPAP